MPPHVYYQLGIYEGGEGACNYYVHLSAIEIYNNVSCAPPQRCGES